MREQLECMEFCLGRSEEPTEILWVRIKESTGKEDIEVGVCYDLEVGVCLIRKKRSPLQTGRSSLMFADPGLREGLQPPRKLQERQHSRTQAIQVFPGVR